MADVAGQPDVAEVGDRCSVSPDDPAIGYADVQYDQPAEEIRDGGVRPAGGDAAAVDRDGAVRLELGGDLPVRGGAARSRAGRRSSASSSPSIVLLVAFGSVIAMGLPIGTALLGLAVSLGLITLVASVADVNSVSPILAAMIGLGVGIDYALFIVTRHRENLRAGHDRRGGGRAGDRHRRAPAVLFAGVTVVIAICGLAIAGIPAVTIDGV